MAFSFIGWIFNQFPYRYKDEDTNKDINGQGTFERYLKNFEEELDEEMYPNIRDFMDLFDVTKVDAKYLPYISYYLGEPPSANNDIAIYRKILAHAVEIYKIKGTKKSFQLLFNLYGLDMDLVEEVPRRKYTYDLPPSVLTYDMGITYDTTCQSCSCYWIAYRPIGEAPNQNPDISVPQEIIDLINRIICWIQPINAKLCGIYRRWVLEDTLALTLQDDANIDITDALRYVNLDAPIAGTVDEAAIIAAYNGGNWDADIDMVHDDLLTAAGGYAMRFYLSTPQGVVNSDWLYGIPHTNAASLRQFVSRWYELNAGDNGLQQAGDYLYPYSPDGEPVYLASAVSVDPTVDINKTLVDFDTLNPLVGCPNPDYPILVYGVDDDAIGVAADAQGFADIWNSYGPNKEYGYLTHLAGCTFRLTRRSDEDDIMAGQLKAKLLTVNPNGDFNEDFTIDPGGDFY